MSNQERPDLLKLINTSEPEELLRVSTSKVVESHGGVGNVLHTSEKARS
jgi:hypothetical protein